MTIPFTYYWIMRKHLDGVTTILDVGCGDGEAMHFINYDKKYQVTGIDLYEPYLETAKSKNVYTKLELGDIRSLKIHEKSFDIVFSSQVVEHLEKEESLCLIDEMEKIAKKKVIVATTNGFFPFDPIQGKDANPLQVHKSGWRVSEMRERGYTVYGQGLGIVYKPEGLGHILKNKHLLKIVFLFSYIVSPIVYIFPQLSAYIIAVKEYEK